jgi:hypothetical protein
MKFPFLVFLLILVAACSTITKSNVFVPIEYTFPEGQIASGKTFVQVDQATGDTSFEDRYHFVKNNREYLIQKFYSAQGTSDSTLYLDSKLAESYSYVFSKTVASRALILLDTIINNGKKLGKDILKVEYKSDSTILSIRSESEFIKDTTVRWRKVFLPTLVIRTTIYSSLKSRFYPSIKTDFKIDYLMYEAKNTGTVKIKLLTPKEKVIDLIDIRNIRG